MQRSLVLLGFSLKCVGQSPRRCKMFIIKELRCYFTPRSHFSRRTIPPVEAKGGKKRSEPCVLSPDATRPDGGATSLSQPSAREMPRPLGTLVRLLSEAPLRACPSTRPQIPTRVRSHQAGEGRASAAGEQHLHCSSEESEPLSSSLCRLQQVEGCGALLPLQMVGPSRSQLEKRGVIIGLSPRGAPQWQKKEVWGPRG